MPSKYAAVVSIYDEPKPVVLFGSELKEFLPRVIEELHRAGNGVVVLTEDEKEIPFPQTVSAYSVKVSETESLLISLPDGKPLVNDKGVFDVD